MLSGAQWWQWSGYIEQVRSIAPPLLAGRETELAELAGWCFGDEPTVVRPGGPGTTELLSWFALHPPEGTWVVSCFDDESSASPGGWAMCDALVDQLSAIVGPPQDEMDTDRARHVPQLLEWAMYCAGNSGRRLVLVLDTSDPESLRASWLPTSVPSELRVIVAGRTDAELPGQRLGRPAAPGALNRLVELATDLGNDDRLLDLPGGPAAILAQVCAAQELLGRQPEPDLAVALKLSVRRAGLRARPAHARLAPVWAVLGNAVRALSVACDVDDVGESWQATIEVAQAVAGGGDGALAEAIARRIGAFLGIGEDALSELIGGVTPAWDLQWAERVAQSLTDAETRQTALAAVEQAVADRGREGASWFRPGAGWPETHWRHPGLEELFKNADHAAACAEACGLPDPDDRVTELVKVAAALDRAGAHDHAVEAAAQAEVIADTAVVPWKKDWPPAIGAKARAQALDIVARTWAALGERERAEAVVRTITCEPFTQATNRRRFPFDPFDQAEAMVRVAGEILRDGDRERAAGLVERAEATARGDDRPGFRADALALVAQVWCAMDERARAENAARAASLPPVPTADEVKAAAGMPVTAASSAAAAADARLVASPLQRVQGLVDAIRITTDGELRARLAAEAVAVIRAVVHDIDEGFHQAWAINSAVESLTELGQVDLAEMVADTVREPAIWAEPFGTEDRIKALCRVASARADNGDRRRAAQLATEAEVLARTLTRPYRLAHGLAIATTAWVAAKERDRAAGLAAEAEAVAKAIEDDHWRGLALAEVIAAMLAIGDRERAAALALAVARPNNLGREDALVAVVEAMAAAGEQERAEALARSFTTPYARLMSLLAVGDYAVAAETASSETDPDRRATGLVEVVEAMARVGRVEEADQLAQSITVSTRRAEAFAAVAEHCDLAHARRLLVQALAIGGWAKPLSVLARIDPAAAQAAAAASSSGLPGEPDAD